MDKYVNVIVRNDKAYVPTFALTKGGPYMAVEPIYITSLTVKDLTIAIGQCLAVGHPEIERLSKEEFKHRKDPILAATGAKSWNALAKSAFSYAIYWHNETITLYLHALDEKGRFTTTPERTLTYPTGTLISTMVEAILADATSIELEIKDASR